MVFWTVVLTCVEQTLYLLSYLLNTFGKVLSNPCLVLGLLVCTTTPGLCSAGDPTQGLLHARQTLYHPTFVLCSWVSKFLKPLTLG